MSGYKLPCGSTLCGLSETNKDTMLELDRVKCSEKFYMFRGQHLNYQDRVPVIIGKNNGILMWKYKGSYYRLIKDRFVLIPQR